MILEALAIVFGSFTVVSLGSLVFVQALLKAERDEERREEEREAKEAIEEAKKASESESVPFLQLCDDLQTRIYAYWPCCVTNQDSCVLCGSDCEWEDGDKTTQVNGPGIPRACKDKDCPAIGISHLHVKCMTCQSTYLMRSKNA